MILDVLFEKGLFTIRRADPDAEEVRDDHGRVVRSGFSEQVVNGILQPTGTAEGEAFVVDHFRAVMPIGTDLRAGDEVLAQGKRYTVEGTPFTAHPPGVKTIGTVTAVLKYVGAAQ